MIVNWIILSQKSIENVTQWLQIKLQNKNQMPEPPGNREFQGKEHWIPYPMKRFFSLKEASIYTAMSEVSIKQAYYQGQIPAIQRGKRSKLVFDVEDLNAYMLQDKKRHSAVDTKIRGKDGRFL